MYPNIYKCPWLVYLIFFADLMAAAFTLLQLKGKRLRSTRHVDVADVTQNGGPAKNGPGGPRKHLILLALA